MITINTGLSKDWNNKGKVKEVTITEGIEKEYIDTPENMEEPTITNVTKGTVADVWVSIGYLDGDNFIGTGGSKIVRIGIDDYSDFISSYTSENQDVAIDLIQDGWDNL